MSAPPFAYAGPADLRQPILDALNSVVDPEVALNIVDVGLVYAVRVDDRIVHVDVTMTSAACPVADVIVDDVETALDRAMPPDLKIKVDLVWEPPWTTDRMSESARRLMGW